MPKKLKVSLAYNRYPDAMVGEISTAILAAMTGNPAFPTPIIPLPTVATACKILSARRGQRRRMAASN
jgi:hypothetical protein